MSKRRLIVLREPSRYDPQGVVYAIQALDGGPVKIGWVSRPLGLKNRLALLQCGNPAELQIVWTRPGGQRYERQLHRRFAAERLRGEWFDESVLEVREEEAA